MPRTLPSLVRKRTDRLVEQGAVRAPHRYLDQPAAYQQFRKNNHRPSGALLPHSVNGPCEKFPLMSCNTIRYVHRRRRVGAADVSRIGSRKISDSVLLLDPAVRRAPDISVPIGLGMLAKHRSSIGVRNRRRKTPGGRVLPIPRGKCRGFLVDQLHGASRAASPGATTGGRERRDRLVVERVLPYFKRSNMGRAARRRCGWFGSIGRPRRVTTDSLSMRFCSREATATRS